MTRIFCCAVLLCLTFWTCVVRAELRAGAYAADITPVDFPVIVNGGFLPASADTAHSKLHARCLVLDDGKETMALVVVDSCTLPGDLVKEIKAAASKATGIPIDQMMISATHTHSAPSLMPLLGVPADPHYPDFIKPRVVEGIERAFKNLQPAKAGWGVVAAPEHVHNRQWVFRPDRMLSDPFGNVSVRVNMHPGYQNTSTIGPAGPVDPDLSMLSFQTPDGKPIAVFANFSMHYYGSPPLNADYCGLFSEKLQKMIAPDNSAFMAALSQGTSGDLMWPDYGNPDRGSNMEAYSESLAKIAHEAWQKIEHRDDFTLSMAETDLQLRVREPDAERLAWAKQVIEGLEGREPQNLPEIYAREAIYLHENPERVVKLQAIRVGDFGITAIPNEVFGITGLKIKAQSPLAYTMNVELANDEVGYIPPPEFHPLGGYTTWPARSACLEVEAEPKIVDALLGLLEKVAEKPRRPIVETHGAYAQAVLAWKPLAYWRLNEITGPTAADAAGNLPATYETGVLFYLDGPDSPAFSGEGVVNRAPQFAGGRMAADAKGLGGTYSVEMWFWNGLANEARAVTGYLISRGAAEEGGEDQQKQAAGDHIGIGGTAISQGKLIFFNGNSLNTVLAGNTTIDPKTWNHVVYVRDGEQVRVYLNGNAKPEIEGEAEVGHAPDVTQFFFGGRNDNLFNLEGRVDEVALYDRALSGEDAAAHYKASRFAPKQNAQGLQFDDPKSPEEALQALRVKEGFIVEQVAAEPMVLDPVALAWGPDGKLWVAEMADYPYGVDGKMTAGSRIRVLEDTDDDGAYDKSTVFMHPVNFPTGVLPWRKGVIVTAAPEIFYAEDTDGDGVADKKEVLFTGFTEGNPQLRVNGLQWGLDNWVYCANGWSSQGEIVSTKTGAKVQVGGRDIRIRPDDGGLDTDTGMTEFGRNRNDWGEWFGCNNSEPLWHYVLSDRYTRRNPHVAPPELRYQLTPKNPKVYPLSRPEKRYHSFEQAGRFTSACGTIIYRDELLFPRGGGEVPHHAFVCEPVHNLVQHLEVTDDGVTFKASRAKDEEARDFLASPDTWFRPVFLTTGPDGALYVADMYRQMIEHPDWLPQEGKDELRPVYRNGEDRGRIYRVYPDGKKPGEIPRLDKMTTDQLVAALDSTNGWQRDTVQMMLLWRADPAAVAPLRKLVTQSTNPLARLHALCTLDGLDALESPVIVQALRDEHWGVRRHALRLAEARGKEAADLVQAAVKLADDPDPRVRLQLACALGEWADPKAGAALGKLALRDAADTYISAAVMSSAGAAHYEAVADALLGSHRLCGGPMHRGLMAMALSLNNRDLIARLLDPILLTEGTGPSVEQLQAFSQWLDVLAQAKISPEQLSQAASDALATKLAQGATFFDHARAIAADDSQPLERRAAAVALLGREPANAQGDLDRLAALFRPQTPGELQHAAASAAGRVDDPRVPEALLKDWASHSPGVRLNIAELLLAKEPWAFALAQAIQSQQVAPLDLDLARRQRLLNHESARVKELAQAVLANVTTVAGRQKAIDSFSSSLGLEGDLSRGAVIFTQNCAVCHRFDDQGNEIGPNLRQVSNWDAAAMLAAILDPNRQVEPRYISYNATLANGELIFGVISEETGNSITMKQLDGTQRTILRTELQSLTSTNRSLMPEGFEASIKKQEMTDLIHFLRAPPSGK